SADNSITVWNCSDGSRRGPPLKHINDIRGMTFFRDGKRLLTWCKDGYARIWNLEDGSLAAMPMHHNADIIAAWITSDEARTLALGSDETVRNWYTVDGWPLGELERKLTTAYGGVYGSDD